ncbi:hypothetical protein GEMRC1_009044 [Eukaryota sp. GEM-RC1]
MPSVTITILRPPPSIWPVSISSQTSVTQTFVRAGSLSSDVQSYLLRSIISFDQFSQNQLIWLTNDHVKYIVDFLTPSSIPITISLSLAYNSLFSSFLSGYSDACLLLEGPPITQRLLSIGWSTKEDSFPGIFSELFSYFRARSFSMSVPVSFSFLLVNRSSEYDLVSCNTLSRYSKTLSNLPRYSFASQDIWRPRLVKNLSKLSSCSPCMVMFLVYLHDKTFLFLSSMTGIKTQRSSPESKWLSQSMINITRMILSIKNNQSRDESGASRLNLVTRVFGSLQLDSKSLLIHVPLIDYFAFENENRSLLSSVSRLRSHQSDLIDDVIIPSNRVDVGRLFKESVGSD